MRKFYIFLFLAVLMPFAAGASEPLCKKIPSCYSLGYTMNESDCQVGIDYLKCPYDNKWVYCPEDCSTYPLAICDTSIGTCKQCGLEGRWKYTSCNAGLVLKDGRCTKDETCSAALFPFSSRPENLLGSLKNCRLDDESVLYGYSSCKTGYSLTSDGDCVETQCGEEYVDLGNSCPDFADCSDICMSGNVKYTKIKCEDGRKVENNKCVRYKVGEVYYYKDMPIGIVYADDGVVTRIVALTDSDESGNPRSAAISLCSLNLGTGLAFSKDMKGKSNTDYLLIDSLAKKEKTPAGNAVRTYAPEICETNSICGQGQWYLPAYGEMKYIAQNLSVINASLETVENATIMQKDQRYWLWSGRESNGYLRLINLETNTDIGAIWSFHKYYVRPVLQF